jgi:small subunit ribosomal protein S6e
VDGPGRKRIILTAPPGFHPASKGLRKRKSVRGNTISADTAQINVKVVKEGQKSVEELLGVKKKETVEKKEEKAPEKKAEEKKEEGKKEEKKE